MTHLQARGWSYVEGCDSYAGLNPNENRMHVFFLIIIALIMSMAFGGPIYTLTEITNPSQDKLK
jgi:hypothetical protein